MKNSKSRILFAAFASLILLAITGLGCKIEDNSDPMLEAFTMLSWWNWWESNQTKTGTSCGNPIYLDNLNADGSSAVQYSLPFSLKPNQYGRLWVLNTVNSYSWIFEINSIQVDDNMDIGVHLLNTASPSDFSSYNYTSTNGPGVTDSVSPGVMTPVQYRFVCIRATSCTGECTGTFRVYWQP